jgi:hypothetical protein
LRIGVGVSPYEAVGARTVKSWIDLRKKTVMIGGAKDITRVYFEDIAKPNGLAAGEYDYVFAGSTAARFSALTSGSVAATILFPPFNFLAIRDGYTKLGLSADYTKSFPFSAYSVNLNWAELRLGPLGRRDARALLLSVLVAPLDETTTGQVKGWLKDLDSDDFPTRIATSGHQLEWLMIALEQLPFDSIHRLRQIDGLPGHPDVGTVGIVTNTGSLGMGISKGRGIAWAKRHLGRGGRVVSELPMLPMAPAADFCAFYEMYCMYDPTGTAGPSSRSFQITSVFEPGSHWSMQPCCQHQARVSPKGIQRSWSARSIMPTVMTSLGSGVRFSKAASMLST